jgi:hypothetical protein
MAGCGSQWATVKEAASAARVCEWTVYQWCRAGRVVARRVVGVWRVQLGPDGLPVEPPPRNSERAAH